MNSLAQYGAAVAARLSEEDIGSKMFGLGILAENHLSRIDASLGFELRFEFIEVLDKYTGGSKLEDYVSKIRDEMGLGRIPIKEFTPELVYQAVMANMYAAADHIYMTLFLLQDADVCSAQAGHSLVGTDAFTIMTQLERLDKVAGKILEYEKLVDYVYAEALDFSQTPPDYSWNTRPHWEGQDFMEYFGVVRTGVEAALAKETNTKVTLADYFKSRDQKYHNINALIERLGKV